jgi:hypothetical protein
MSNNSYQTLSRYRGSKYFESFNEAFAAYIADGTIHQISFGDQIWIIKWAHEKCSNLVEMKLRKMSESYSEGKYPEPYWIRRSMVPKNYENQWKHRIHLLSEKWAKEQYNADCIEEVLREDDFRNTFMRENKI